MSVVHLGQCKQSSHTRELVERGGFGIVVVKLVWFVCGVKASKLWTDPMRGNITHVQGKEASVVRWTAHCQL